MKAEITTTVRDDVIHLDSASTNEIRRLLNRRKARDTSNLISSIFVLVGTGLLVLALLDDSVGDPQSKGLLAWLFTSGLLICFMWANSSYMTMNENQVISFICRQNGWNGVGSWRLIETNLTTSNIPINTERKTNEDNRHGYETM